MRLLKNLMSLGVFIFALLTLVIATPAHAVQQVSGNANLSADGSVNGVDFTADATLTAANGTTINSAGNPNGVTTATNNTGSLGFLGNATVNGVVGTASTGLIRQISGGAAGTQAIFTGGNVFATTTTVNDTGTITFGTTSATNLTGSTISFTGNGGVRFADGGNVTLSGTGSEPNVTTSVNNQGSLTFLGTSTVTGQIGSTSNRLALVSGGAASGKIVKFQNDVFAVSTSVAGTGSLVFNGNLTGTTLNFAGNGLVEVADGKNLDVTQITTSANNTGSIVFKGASTISPSGTSIGTGSASLHNVDINGGIVTLSSSSTGYFVTTTNVNSGGTFKMAGNSTITGAVTLAGTGIMDVGANTATITGVYTQPAGTTLKTTITNATTAGNIIATTVAPSVAAASTVNVTVAGYVPNGTAYKIIDASAAGITAPTTITDNSALLSFAASVSSNDLFLTATRSFTGIATNPNSSAVGDALNSFTPAGDMAIVDAAIDALSTTEDVEHALEQLEPDVNGGLNQAAINTVNGSLETIDTRLGNIRNGTANGNGQMGVSTGDEFRDLGLWGQGFGAYGDQNDRNGIAGYTAGTWGLAGGLDGKINENARMGLGLSYADSTIDTNGSSSTTDAKNYQGTLYGSYDAEKYYVDAMFAFGWNEYDGSRHIQFGTIDRIADASYSGQQYSTKWTFGYKLPYDNFTLIPLASLLYSHLDIEGYTETNAGDVNLVVKSQSYDFLQSGLGARIEIPVRDQAKRISWLPELHALWLYEFVGDEAAATATFAGGGASFKTTGFSPEQSTLNAGAGVTVYPNDTFSIRFKYDFDYRDDYTSHAGTATLRWEF